MVYIVWAFCNSMDVDDNMVIEGIGNYWERCPICHGPLEEVYYGGGVTKWECNRCVKHFVTEIYNEPK